MVFTSYFLVSDIIETGFGLICDRIVVNYILCSSLFAGHSIVCSYWLLPALVLKRMVIGNFERGTHDSEMSDAIDFVVDCVSKSVYFIFIFALCSCNLRLH